MKIVMGMNHRPRDWCNQDFGTGKKAPEGYSMSGGVPFHAPVKFRFAANGASSAGLHSASKKRENTFKRPGELSGAVKAGE